jgi:diguanylate cyclase
MGRTTWQVPRAVGLLRMVVPVVAVLYAATLLPGVRGPEPVLVGWLDTGVGLGVIAASAALCFLRAWLVRQERRAWTFLGLAPLAYVSGDLYYYAALQGSDVVPYPSWGDLGWIGLYPLLVTGLVLLLRARVTGVRTSLWLDGLTGGFGAAALLGALVLRPVLEVTDGSLAIVLTNLAYPVADLGVLTVLMLVFNLHGWRPGRSWWLLAWVVVALLGADTMYLLQVAAGTYVDAGLLDAGWSLALGTLGVAAWHRPPAVAVVREGSANVAVPATLSVLSTGVLFAGAVRALPLVVCLAGLATVLLASARLFFALVESHRLMAARLEARTDELTGLPNRRSYLESVEAALHAGRPVAVMIVDLDRFKQVNDSLGHAVGDNLLQVLGRRMAARIRSEQTLVARLGGDEFAVLVEGCAEEAAYAVAERLRTVIGEAVQLAGLTLRVDSSVGIAFAPRDGSTWEALLARADAAMYAAKRGGTGTAQYDAVRDADGVDRLALLADLRVALETNRLEVHYQPVRSLHTGRVTSAEALVRWTHPTRGRLSPAEFLPVAVEAGLSRQLSDEVLRMATDQAARWYAEGLDVPVAVNLTESDLTDPELLGRIAAQCARAGLPARSLMLEITESTVAAVMDTALPALAALRAQGHVLALDDFGTGYSSLWALRSLPIDVLKLDRSVIAAVGTPATDAVVAGTVSVGHALGMKVLAEGVETIADLEALRLLGCDSVQGFVLHRPASGPEITAVLRTLATGSGAAPVAAVAAGSAAG